VAGPEAHARIGDARAGEVEILLGAVDADDGVGRAARDDRVGQSAGPAPDVEPAEALGRVEPAQELPCDETAPATHIRLIGVAARPGVTMVGHQILLL